MNSEVCKLKQRTDCDQRIRSGRSQHVPVSPLTTQTGSYSVGVLCVRSGSEAVSSNNYAQQLNTHQGQRPLRHVLEPSQRNRR